MRNHDIVIYNSDVCCFWKADRTCIQDDLGSCEDFIYTGISSGDSYCSGDRRAGISGASITGDRRNYHSGRKPDKEVMKEITVKDYRMKKRENAKETKAYSLFLLSSIFFSYFLS